MQQFVTCLQGGAHKQQTALLLVVIDIGFNRSGVKSHLRLGS